VRSRGRSRHVCARHGADPNGFAAELQLLEKLSGDGLVSWTGNRIEIPEEARPLVRSVCAVFDTRLQQAAGRYAPAL
jgi:oxygen-independent coproporphyrinogen-3 oxidase